MNMDELKRLPIWNQMNTKCDADEVSIVQNHVEYILPLMERYTETFPLYTLHNRDHVLNVIRIMGELLGEQVEQLSGLEAMVLILSSVYHDFGMVFTEEERARIGEYEDFKLSFLNEFPAARLSYEQQGRVVTKDLAEWYCRWAHAVRVWLKIEEMEAVIGKLNFRRISIKKALGDVCASHNETIENIRIDDARFDPSYLGECDLRFCALLLRLADILDFDNSRSPQSVYDYLDISNPRNYSEQISKDEWNKHMASHGFRFTGKADAKPLLFIANPPHPYIEQGIHNFLNLIDLELVGALKVSKLCDDRWKAFPFPERIERGQIKSENYLSGKYKFTLSEDKILDLLTGDNLYSDNFVFIRELLQNAIDTVRHRSYVEKCANPEYQPQPIEVSFFQDHEGYNWLRVDDEGMGMDLNIIETHLLNKGNSYYNSDLFKLEKLKISEKIQDEFSPISRFGIGLLSCFITCDKIEISTCYAYPSNGRYEKNRMSIEGRSGFWVVQSDAARHTPIAMPNQDGLEKGYRKTPGTSIACRIKTSHEYLGLNIEHHLKRFLLAPEIPVIFEGQPIGGDWDEMVNTPWCDYLKTSLSQDFVDRCSTLLEVKIESIAIEVLPVDLTRDSGTSKLSGQMVVVVPRIIIVGRNKYYDIGHYFRIDQSSDKTLFFCFKKSKDANGRDIEIEEHIDISSIIAHINIPKDLYLPYERRATFSNPRISHNGIVIHDANKSLVVQLDKFDHFNLSFSRNRPYFLSAGLFCFKDSLLPEVVVSRNTIKRFGELIIANLYYATRRLLEFNYGSGALFTYLPDLEQNNRFNNFSIEVFEAAGIYERDLDFWNNLPCVDVIGKGTMSINELNKENSKEKIQFWPANFGSEFYNYFSRFILIKNLDITFLNTGDDGYYLEGTARDRSTPITEALRLFRPLSFLECDDYSKIVLANLGFNKNHPLIKWYLNNAVIINNEYQHLGWQFLDKLLHSDSDVIPSVNAILDRFRTLLPENDRPAPTLNLKESDL
ncbi:HD domain-containing protein [Sediminibacterium ginsengisoli]|uniref:HD-CE domain-containing protein n=1 Tax=Sediminibacterium ginsengisoli TaxID=413434 RepID=A0A1T4P198_9BACT|nr:hypothetical protein [Sediminibacterium ginsengisoli]SJZ84728.1 hypothetical protein SAMN04488132_10571 [Sediminibacterium ginsengisoli]